jgi:hypothetical protein
MELAAGGSNRLMSSSQLQRGSSRRQSARTQSVRSDRARLRRSKALGHPGKTPRASRAITPDRTRAEHPENATQNRASEAARRVVVFGCERVRSVGPSSYSPDGAQTTNFEFSDKA